MNKNKNLAFLTDDARKKLEEIIKKYVENDDRLYENINELSSINDLRELIDKYLKIETIKKDMIFTEILKECNLNNEESIMKVNPSELLKESIEYIKDVKILEEENYSKNTYIRNLKDKNDETAYKKMIKNTIVGKALNLCEPSLSEEINKLSKQIWSLVGFMLTIAAAFLFGYFASTFAFENEAVRAGFGLFLMKIVFFAEIYFIAVNEKF